MTRLLILALKRLEILSAVAIRLVVLTGKSPHLIHPKHLITQSTPKYLKYFKKSDLVADIGCHAGEHSFKIAGLVKQITAVDYDTRFLEIAAAEKKARDIKNIQLKLVNIEDGLPFAENSFDKVLFLDVIEHLNKREFVLAEIFKILKNDGLMIISAPNKDTSWKRLQKKYQINYYSDPDHKIEFTKDQFETLIKKSKFKILSFEYIAYDSYLNPIIDLVGGVSLNLYQKLQLWKKEQSLKNPLDCVGFLVIAKKL